MIRAQQYQKDALIQKLTVERDEKVKEIAQLKQSLKVQSVTKDDKTAELNDQLKAENQQLKSDKETSGIPFSTLNNS